MTIVKRGGCIVINESSFTPEFLMEKIREAQVGWKYPVMLSGRDREGDEYRQFIREVIQVMME